MPTAPRKRLLLQGATGSIGASVLSVVRAHPDRFQVVGLAARSSAAALFDLAVEFHVESLALEVDSVPGGRNIAQKGPTLPRVYAGNGAVAAQAAEAEYDLLVNSLTGSAGLEPTFAALERGLPVALANKETLVAAGPLVMQAAREHGTHVLPIDSEHSAIFQCLMGERIESVRKIWLTSSGGPFWGRKQADLDNVTVAEALAHPTWKMGPKISVDSATLFNKGLEVIEAERLFGVPVAQIDVVAHRQSVVHSLVEFTDGNFKAQLSAPDMRLPILFALSYPDRVASTLVPTDIRSLGALTFAPVTRAEFPCLELAFKALAKGGTAPAALSAADEAAVEAFLAGRIRFTDIARVIAEVLAAWPDEPLQNVETVRAADRRARALAGDSLRKLSRLQYKVTDAVHVRYIYRYDSVYRHDPRVWPLPCGPADGHARAALLRRFPAENLLVDAG